MRRVIALVLALACACASAQTQEIILDNVSPVFATTGTWPASTAVTGFIGTNYQSKVQSAPPGAVVVDNTDAGFSVTGTWAAERVARVSDAFLMQLVPELIF